MNNNIKMQNFKSQAGWTIWSLIFTLGTIGFFAYVGMKLVPVYSENQNIVNAMQRSIENQDLRRVTRGKIIQAMEKQLYLDGADELIDYKEALKVTRNRTELNIVLDYERKIPLFANISLVASFNPSLECDLGGSCEKK